MANPVSGEMGILDKLKGVLGNPTQFFNSVKSEDIGPAFKYLAVVGLILLVLLAIVFYVAAAFITSFLTMFGSDASILALFTFLGPAIAIGIGIVAYIAILIGSFIGAAILHVFAYIVGARKGYTNTYKASAYASTPNLILGWIPFVNIITGLWAWYLTVKGLSVLHEISMGRAFLATLIPIIIAAVILFAGILLSIPFYTYTGT